MKKKWGGSCLSGVAVPVAGLVFDHLTDSRKGNNGLYFNVDVIR